MFSTQFLKSQDHDMCSCRESIFVSCAKYVIVDKNQSHQKKKLTNNVRVHVYIHLSHLQFLHLTSNITRFTMYVLHVYIFLFTCYILLFQKFALSDMLQVYIYIYILCALHLAHFMLHFSSSSFRSYSSYLIGFLFSFFQQNFFFSSLLLISFISLRVCFSAFFSLYLRFFVTLFP